jgi:poly(A) RNA polymerase
VQRHCEEVARIVQSFLPGCQDVQKILNARVPIVKYSQQFAGLECDLQMSSSSGLHMSCLLHLWAGLDWRVRPLAATVKRWAKVLMQLPLLSLDSLPYISLLKVRLV